MIAWTQNYDPLNNTFLSTAVAALPVVVLLGSIAVLKIRIHFAALLGLAVALAVALWAYGMPVKSAAATTVYGAGYGLFPIGWIILNLIFLYQLTVEKGLFQVLRGSLAGLAPDPRVQLILIAFSFGAFFEGAAGFGTPVAVTAAILMQLGFKPLAASGLSLIANTAPVAFGALGTPIIALSKVTGLDEMALSQMVGRQLPFFSLLVPFWVVWAMAGWRGMLGVWPAALTAGVAFAVPQFVVSNYHGPWLVDIVASLCSIVALVALLKVWQPKDHWNLGNNSLEARRPQERHLIASNRENAQRPTFNVERSKLDVGRFRGLGGFLGTLRGVWSRANPSAEPGAASQTAMRASAPPDRAQLRRAWVPWILLSVLVFIWGTPQVKKFLNGAASLQAVAKEFHLPLPAATDRVRLPAKVTAPEFPVPNLDGVILRGPRVAPPGTPPEKAVFTLNWLSGTGTGILFAALLAGLYMGFTPLELVFHYARTLKVVRFSLVTIAAMLALGYVTKYSGTDATLGLALAQTGALYPFFGTLLGWLGVALTGSDTASNVLFGGLQKITAEQTGVSPVLMAAANSSGGVMGKMVDAQSIVVASTATNWYGHEGSILRYVFFHSLALAALVGLLVYLQAYVPPFTRMVVPLAAP